MDRKERTEDQWLDENGDLRYPAREALLLLQHTFRRQAWRMSRDNLSLIDDVIQEMCMGVLFYRRDHTLSFFRNCAVNRARFFLRKERRHRGRVNRYSRLRHQTTVDDSTGRIEALVDIHDRLERKEVTPWPERKESA